VAEGLDHGPELQEANQNAAAAPDAGPGGAGRCLRRLVSAAADWLFPEVKLLPQSQGNGTMLELVVPAGGEVMRRCRSEVFWHGQVLYGTE
jgi:hypothetical protein